jgi:uncharacterized membrane protein YoaK (UPF0700 family)
MGTNVSKQMIESTTEIVNNSLTQISSEIENSISANTTSIQTMNLDWKNVKINCSVNISQTATVSVSVMLQNTAKLANDLTNRLSGQLTEKLVNDLQQANEGLNLLSTNISSSTQKTSSYLKNNIKNVIHTGIKNSIKINSMGVQTLNMDLSGSVINCPSSGVFRVSQKMQLDTIAKNISTALVTNAIKNSLDASVIKELKNKTKQLNEGLSFSFGLIILLVVGGGGYGIYKFGTDKKKIMMIAIAVFVLIIIIYIVYYLKEKKDIEDDTNPDHLYE